MLDIKGAHKSLPRNANSLGHLCYFKESRLKMWYYIEFDALYIET
jgi:hypothetical protein